MIRILTVAKFVSVVFGAPWIFLLIGALLFKTGLKGQNGLILQLLLATFQLIIPAAFLFHSYVKGRIHDIDISKREERVIPLTIIVFSYAIALILTSFLGTPILLHLQLILFIAFLVNYIVTLFWKISLHMAVTVVGTILLNALFGWTLPILFLAIPLVFWSRYVLKKHTLGQLMAGLIVNLIILFVGLWYFGYV